MRDFKSLGTKKYGKSRPFPEFSDAEVQDFEQAFGVTLPSDYIQFLRFSNGGTLELSEYPDPETCSSGEINDFYGLGSRSSDALAAVEGKIDHGNLWSETRIFRKILFDGPGVPIARDGGDNQIFLDFRDGLKRISRLIFATRKAYPLASSFEEFIGKLRVPTPIHVTKAGRQMVINDPDKGVRERRQRF